MLVFSFHPHHCGDYSCFHDDDTDDHSNNKTHSSTDHVSVLFTMASLQLQPSLLSGDGHHHHQQSKEILNALKEAKARGLPDGWKCVIDVSHLSLYLLVVDTRNRFSTWQAPVSGHPGRTRTLLYVIHTYSSLTTNPFVLLCFHLNDRNEIGGNGRHRMEDPAIRFPRPWQFQSN